MARVAPEKADFRPALPLGFLPGVNGTHMGKMTYSEQLKHPFWQRKRLEVLQAAGFACEACGDSETTLNVHHKRYVKGRMVWEYSNDELQCVCQPCHQAEHEAQDTFAKVIDSFDEPAAPRALLTALAEASGRLELSDDEKVAAWRGDANMFQQGYAVALLELASPAARACLWRVFSGVVKQERPALYAAWKSVVSGNSSGEVQRSEKELAADLAFAEFVQWEKDRRAALPPEEAFE